MARGKLWSVKGVSHEAREAAKAAAQDAGQPIGIWIDQAIRMSDEDLPRANPPTTAPADDPTTEEIIRVLEALEARVASHADHISEQLAPVRDSITALSARLERLEQDRASAEPVVPGFASPDPAPSATTDTPTSADREQDLSLEPDEAVSFERTAEPDISPPDSMPETSGEPEPDPEPTPAPEPPPDPEPIPDPDSEPVFRADTRPPAPDRGRERTPETEISEDDIRAADAALKSELTGLFDDGAHRHTPPPPRSTSHDPFLPPPPPPPRPSSRAPLVVIFLILLLAAGGMGAFAWFQLTTPEDREFFSLSALTEKLDPKALMEGLLGDDETFPANPDTDPDTARETAPSAEPAAPPPPPLASTPTASAPPTSAPAGTAAEPAGEAPAPPPAAPAGTTGNAARAGGDPELVELLRAANDGSASAQNELGVRYLVGRGVAQDYEQAARWLRAAAAQNVPGAQYNLGVLYDSGRGVQQDPTEALIWFHSAAENGHGRAQMAMAAAYAAGRGIERNPDVALMWLRRAANSNIGEAQLSLANILATSPESHESLIDALFWYRVADANGVTEAAERGDQVATQLTADERAGVNRRVSHFVSENIAPSPRRPQTPAAPARNDAPPAPPALPPPPDNTRSDAPDSPAPHAVAREPQIAEIQRLLAKLGFEPGPADGAIGERTRDAIRTYQKELGLPVTGRASVDLLSHIRRIAGNG